MQGFTVFPPEAEETPVVVEVPHAGLLVPPTCLARLVAPGRALAQDADLYVDELYAGAPREGATLLIAHASRYVVDLNRAESDADADCVQGFRTTRAVPRGIVWRLTGDGTPALSEPLTPAEFHERLTTFYRPYHAKLRALLDAKRQRFGHAILLAAHSMPSVPTANPPRADVVPGSRGRTTAAPTIIDAVETHAREQGLSVRHDDPYRGGFSTQHYGTPKSHVHAIQVELARRLYMDEATFDRLPTFGEMQTWCASLVRRLGHMAP